MEREARTGVPADILGEKEGGAAKGVGTLRESFAALTMSIRKSCGVITFCTAIAVYT